MKDLTNGLLNDIEDALSNYVIEFEADTLRHYVLVDFQGRKFFKATSFEEGNPQEDNKVLLRLIKQIRGQIIDYLQKKEEKTEDIPIDKLRNKQ